MTNKEIKELCLEQQAKRGNEYPDWKFKVTQTDKEIKISWEYLDTTWKINKEHGYVTDEHDQFIMDELEDTTSLTNTINSIVYYMTTRY